MARPTSHFAVPTWRVRTTQLCVVAIACCAIGIPAGGCRSNAYSDVYNQKLASEVRVLEDQLYDADYQNRVLQEKLERATQEKERLRQQQKLAPNESKTPSRLKSFFPTPQRDPSANANSSSDFDLGDDVDALNTGEWIDPGTPAELDALDAKGKSPEKAPKKPAPTKKAPLLPSPGGPEPPGPSDMKIPQIEPGELLPPPSTGGEPEKPPGQILLPDAVRAVSPGGAKAGVPTSLSIHPGLSAGHKFDDGDEGLYLIVNVLDEQQRPLDLESFDIDAPMTIVATDPDKDLESSLVGRWEFDRTQVSKMIRNEPVSGLAIPLRWKDNRPSGDSVVVHVRIKGELEEMRCEAKLSVKPKTAVAEWMPRSPNAKR